MGALATIEQHDKDPIALLEDAEKLIPRDREERILPVGYADLLHKDWLFNDDLTNTRTPEAAVFLRMTKRALDIPDDLHWNNLKSEIPEKDHKRMEAIWNALLTLRSQLFRTKRTLEHHWTHPPFWLPDKEAKRFMKETPIDISPKYQKAVRAIISNPNNAANQDHEYHGIEEENSRPVSTLEAWQTTEKQLRWGIFRQQKLYILALRLYYEMLLENTEKDVEEKKRKAREKEARHEEKLTEREKFLRGEITKLRAAKTRAETRIETIDEALPETPEQDHLRGTLVLERKEFDDSLERIKNALRQAEIALDQFLSQKDKTPPAEPIGNPEYVLPKNHPKREEIANRNRILRFIDARNQAIAVGKAAHHQQKKKRVRKTEEVPYLFHALDVTDAMIMDTVPFDMRKDNKKAINLVLMGIIGPLHDILEDTELDIDDLINDFLKRIIDMYDSSLDPVIKSAFNNDRQELKAKLLDLLKSDVKARARKILRILSNNTELTGEEKKKALKQNIAGVPETIRALNHTKGKTKITDADLTDSEKATYGNWKLGAENLENKTITFRRFANDYDDYKLTSFLIRLNAIGDAKDRQLALITKMEDRANNILTNDELATEKQLSNLRSTVTRLITWVIYDHDRENYPVYNALPRLISNTLDAYVKFRNRYPDLITDIDKRCIIDLITWRKDLKEKEDIMPYEYKLPAEQLEILKVYEEEREPGPIPHYLETAMIQGSLRPKPAPPKKAKKK